MKIAIVTPVFPPYKGGMGNVAYHHARILGERGFEVEVFTPNYQEKKTEERIIDSVRTVFIKPKIQYGNAAYIPELKKAIDEFDCIYLYYPFFGGAEALLGVKKKFVIFYHMDVVGKGVFRPLFFLHKKIFLKKILNKARKIAVSSFDYVGNSDVREYYHANSEKFIEISNGVDTKIFYPKKISGLMEELQSRKEWGLENKIVLFVGGLDKAHYFKGVEYLLKAFAQLKINSQLMLIGKGNLVDNYKLQAQELKIQDKVIFCTDVSTENLPKYYNIADVVVLPSIDKSEAFGMVLVEAMACAKPVIASNLSGVRSVVDDGVNGILVEPKNVHGLTSAIERILSDDELAKKMGEEGLKKVREKYEWERVGGKLSTLFNLLKQ